MKMIKDKKIIILAIVLTIFTIGYFVIVNKISYAFANNYDLTSVYENRIETIKKCAIAYGENNLDLFKEEKIIYVKVQDLIDNNLLAANAEGNIINPLKENETLNTNIIKIKYENDEITAEVDS